MAACPWPDSVRSGSMSARKSLIIEALLLSDLARGGDFELHLCQECAHRADNVRFVCTKNLVIRIRHDNNLNQRLLLLEKPDLLRPSLLVSGLEVGGILGVSGATLASVLLPRH